MTGMLLGKRKLDLFLCITSIWSQTEMKSQSKKVKYIQRQVKRKECQKKEKGMLFKPSDWQRLKRSHFLRLNKTGLQIRYYWWEHKRKWPFLGKLCNLYKYVPHFWKFTLRGHDKGQKDEGTRIFTEALPMRGNSWKQLKCPSVGQIK